jgi:hypothetical protein
MNDMFKKIFRNKMDYWHFFGPLVIFGGLGFLVSPWFYIIGFVAVFLWEVWDMHKGTYQDGLDLGYNWYELMFLTSDGIFDPHDMLLGFAGIYIAILIDAVYHLIFYLVG